MIIITGFIDFPPEDRHDVLEACSELQLATREQRGCLDYVWSADPAVPGRVYVFERWEDEASLKAHFEGAYYRDMRKLLRGWEKRHTDIWKYRPDRMERVYDPQGNPRAEFAAESVL